MLAQTSRNNKNKNEVKKKLFRSDNKKVSELRRSPVFFWTKKKKEVAVVWNRQGFLSADRNAFLPVGISTDFGGDFKTSKYRCSKYRCSKYWSGIAVQSIYLVAFWKVSCDLKSIYLVALWKVSYDFKVFIKYRNVFRYFDRRNLFQPPWFQEVFCFFCWTLLPFFFYSVCLLPKIL